MVLQIDGHGYSPAVLDKIVTAGGDCKSFQHAARHLKKLAEVSVSKSHVSNLTHEIGRELVKVRDHQAELHRYRQLPPDPGQPRVELACVEVDGSRIMTRASEESRGVHEEQWKEPKVGVLWRMNGDTFAEDPHPELPQCFQDRDRVPTLVREVHGTSSKTAGRADEAADHGITLDEITGAAAAGSVELPHEEHASAAGRDGHSAPGDQSAAGDQTAASGQTAASDESVPSGETGGDASTAGEGQAVAQTPTAEEAHTAGGAPTVAESRSGGKRWQPQRIFRTCVATLLNVHGFGPLVAAEAQKRGFYQARRKAFIADGQETNWTVQRLHFPDFTPITDFMHAVGYAYAAAAAMVGPGQSLWERYLKYATACWQGRVDEVIEELRPWLEQNPLPQGVPLKKIPDSDPRKAVHEALTYFGNNRERMQYPQYRCQGMPVTSSLVESLIKEFNWRVKGTEKYWNRPDQPPTSGRTGRAVNGRQHALPELSAESILQVRAALLCDDQRLERHLQNRPGSPYVRRDTRTSNAPSYADHAV